MVRGAVVVMAERDSTLTTFALARPPVAVDVVVRSRVDVPLGVDAVVAVRDTIGVVVAVVAVDFWRADVFATTVVAALRRVAARAVSATSSAWAAWNASGTRHTVKKCKIFLILVQ